MIRAIIFLCAITIVSIVTQLTSTALAKPIDGAINIPHAGVKAHDDFLAYRLSIQHRAFAIAPGGSWGWAANQPTEKQARVEALATCEKHTTQRCTLYAVNDQLVFDETVWAGLWGPYLDSEQAAQKRYGRQPGEKFYDLTFLDFAGQPWNISDLRGKVVLVHFWGSWCPPCTAELPKLLELYNTLKDELDQQVEMVLLQVREPYEVASQWISYRGFDQLPIYDSMNVGGDAAVLHLADGSTLPDRYLAQVFPSSYVIDRNGIVIFSHRGAILNWEEYFPFFKHSAETAD